MRRMIVGAVIGTAGLIGFAVPAGAAADQAPHGGETSHPHHVNTGNGCKDMSGPNFEAGDRGRHRAGDESGPAHGPFHGTCE